MVRLLLVRHARPETSPTIEPALWPLSMTGRRAAAELQARLPGSGLWVASCEVKAYETLRCARPDRSADVVRDARFDEVRRDEPYDGSFHDRRRAWVEDRPDDRHERWETPVAAARRFEAAVRDHTRAHDTVVVGTHGMVMTAWLVHARGLVAPGPTAGAFWAALGFPEVVEVPED